MNKVKIIYTDKTSQMLEIDAPNSRDSMLLAVRQADETKEIERVEFFGSSSVRVSASMMGKIGGSSISERKAKASRSNGRKGGRPHKQADR
jgi:hypothetical protein